MYRICKYKGQHSIQFKTHYRHANIKINRSFAIDKYSIFRDLFIHSKGLRNERKDRLSHTRKRLKGKEGGETEYRVLHTDGILCRAVKIFPALCGIFCRRLSRAEAGRSVPAIFHYDDFGKGSQCFSKKITIIL